jgi:hypothetical protein
MISTLQHQTLLLAAKYGGSFVASLATAGLFADPLNRNRLFAAFPELEASYGPTSRFWASNACEQPIRQEVRHG